MFHRATLASPLLVVMAAAIGVCLCTVSSKAQDRQEALGDGHATETRTTEFCRYLHAACVADSVDKRLAVMAAVRDADLSYPEKAWLTFVLADKGMTEEQLITIQPDGALIEMDTLGPTTFFTLFYGLEIRAYAETTKAYLVRLSILKNETYPDGMAQSGAAWIWVDRVRERALKRPRVSINSTVSALVASASDAPASEESFGRLYEKGLDATDDRERLQLAETIRGSQLAEGEKSFLLFSLISPGMRAETASGIAGAVAPVQQSRQRRRKLQSIDNVIMAGEYGPSLPSVTYGSGIKLLITEDAAPVVTDVLLDLQKECR